MSQELPSFKKPPVVEMAISLQFDLIEGFTNAHLGLYWRKVRELYSKTSDAELIENQIEVFGEKIGRRPRLPSFRIFPGGSPTRLQMTTQDDQGMVQLQNGRIVYNWRRGNDSEYPRWHTVLPRFNKAYKELSELLVGEGLKMIKPNQWEVTYVNHFKRGADWDNPKDWPGLVPGIIGGVNHLTVGSVESIGCGAHWVLPENRGRLHIDLHHGYIGVEKDAAEVLVLQLTSRGGFDNDPCDDIGACLEIGHSSIVQAFCEMTGSDAQKRWERES